MHWEHVIVSYGVVGNVILPDFLRLTFATFINANALANACWETQQKIDVRVCVYFL